MVFIFRYLFTLNIIYTFTYMLLGCFKLVVVAFCFVVSLLKYAYFKPVTMYHMSIPDMGILHQLIYSYHLFRCCFLLLCTLAAFELTSLLVHTKSFKQLRKNTISLLRTGPGVFKLFMFAVVMVILSSLVIVCNDSAIGLRGLPDLILTYNSFPLSKHNSTSQAMSSLRTIFLQVLDYTLLSLVFAGLYLSLHIEYSLCLTQIPRARQTHHERC